MEQSKDLLEKGVLATLGFWLLVHEKADDVIRDMIKKGKMAPEEGKHFLEELSGKVDDEKEEIKKRIGSSVRSAIKEAGGVTKEEIEKLELKMSELEGRISVLENKGTKK